MHLFGLVYPGLTDSLVSPECHTHLPSSASIWSSLPWADWLSSQPWVHTHLPSSASIWSSLPWADWLSGQPWVPHPLTQQCIYLVQFTLDWLTLWSAPSATPTLLSNQPHPLTQQCIYLVQFTLGWLTLWSALSASPTYLAVHLSGLVYPGLTDSLVSPECHTHLPSSASIWSSLPWADWFSSQPWVPHPLTQQCIYLV